MNLSANRDACFLNASEACAVEAAVRTAVMSILKLFQQLNEKRSHCYELKLTETERENAALKMQLHAAEQELQTLRLLGSNVHVQSSVEGNPSQDFSSMIPEEPREEPVCLQSFESLLIKEEPCTENTPCLKSEISDETLAPECDYPGMDNVQILQTPGAKRWKIKHVKTLSFARSSFNQTRENSRRLAGDVLTGNSKSREYVRRYRERIRADPEKYHAWKEKERLRYLVFYLSFYNTAD